MVTWIVGLSGAGKTTLSVALCEYLRRTNIPVVRLDGDEVREVWGDHLGHSINDREKNAARMSRLCKLLDEQGIHVVVAILCIFPEWLAWNRKNVSSYFEIYLDVPEEILLQRDSKGLYASAKAGTTCNVVGVDIPFVPPPSPDLVISPPTSLGTSKDILDAIVKDPQIQKLIR